MHEISWVDLGYWLSSKTLLVDNEIALGYSWSLKIQAVITVEIYFTNWDATV